MCDYADQAKADQYTIDACKSAFILHYHRPSSSHISFTIIIRQHWHILKAMILAVAAKQQSAMWRRKVVLLQKIVLMGMFGIRFVYVLVHSFCPFWTESPPPPQPKEKRKTRGTVFHAVGLSLLIWYIGSMVLRVVLVFETVSEYVRGTGSHVMWWFCAHVRIVFCWAWRGICGLNLFVGGD